MNRSQVHNINIKRLTSWKDRLTEQHSTPIVIVGVGHDHNEGQLTVLTTEERTDYEIMLLVRRAADMLTEQMAKRN